MTQRKGGKGIFNTHSISPILVLKTIRFLECSAIKPSVFDVSKVYF